MLFNDIYTSIQGIWPYKGYKTMFGSVIAVVFCAEMYQNDIFFIF
jgi:hypothetical protein